jgi:peptidyl-prolyl cis-trans isomerase D
MKEGDLAGPIRSPFGYHILRATRVIAAELPALNEVKPQLEMRLRQQKYQKALKVWIEELKSSAFIERRL